MSNCISNLTPTAGDCWLQRTPYSSYDNAMSLMYWTAEEADAPSQITSMSTDGSVQFNSESEDDDVGTDRMIPDPDGANKPKDLSATRNAYTHVPHKDRPPMIVARRNARERRRVQAVNFAFTKLRKVVPIINNRGKRVSKVKTLQIAIDYISGLQALLKQSDIIFQEFDIISNYRYHANDYIITNYHNEF